MLSIVFTTGAEVELKMFSRLGYVVAGHVED